MSDPIDPCPTSASPSFWPDRCGVVTDLPLLILLMLTSALLALRNLLLMVVPSERLSCSSSSLWKVSVVASDAPSSTGPRSAGSSSSCASAENVFGEVVEGRIRLGSEVGRVRWRDMGPRWEAAEEG